MTEAAVVRAVVGHAVHTAAHVQPGAGRRVDVPPGTTAVPGLHGAVVRRCWHRVERPRLVRMPRVHRTYRARKTYCSKQENKTHLTGGNNSNRLPGIEIIADKINQVLDSRVLILTHETTKI